MASIHLRDDIASGLHKIAALHRLSVDVLLTALVDGSYTQIHGGESKMNIQNSVFDAISFGVVIVDATQPNQPITYVNQAFERITGYTTDEVIGTNCRFLQGDDRDQPELDRLRDALKAEVECTVTLRNYHKNGTPFWNELKVSPVHDSTGRLIHFIGIQHDITDQVQAQTALQASEARFRSLVSSVEDVIFTIDREGRHTGIYGQWLNKYNMSASDFIGKTQREIVGNFAGGIHEQANSRAFAGETVTYEWQTRVNDEVLTFRVTLSPIRNADDEIVEVVGVGHDITELRALEAERVETERLRLELDKERELLDLKHRFISMVSHEFRTPLSVIMSTSNMLEQYYDQLDKVKFIEYIQRLVPQVQQMNAMLDDVLMLSKATAGMLDFRPEPFRVQAFCEKLIEDQELIDEGTHRIRLDVGNLPTYYRGDRALIQHILSNLMSNARKYSPPETLIVLYVCCDGDLLVLQVSDQGIGIPEADQKYLFQPFQRATNTGDVRGTGLGLSIVKSCVDAHNGTIHYTTSATDGTTFTVRLPNCSGA